MKWYWTIDCDNVVDNPLIVSAHDFRGIDASELKVATPINGWSPFAWMRATNPEDDGVPDDVLQNHLGLPIFSPRLQQALASAGVGGVQFLPIRIFRPNGILIAGFAIANFLDRRAALVRDRSEYEVFPDDYFLPERRGQVRAIQRPVLNEELLRGCDIIRLDEYPVAEYVSERFKKGFESAHCTGYTFREVELLT